MLQVRRIGDCLWKLRIWLATYLGGLSQLKTKLGPEKTRTKMKTKMRTKKRMKTRSTASLRKSARSSNSETKMKPNAKSSEL